MEDVFFAVLFINAVDGNFEKSFFSVEFVFSIVFRESDGYIYAVEQGKGNQDPDRVIRIGDSGLSSLRKDASRVVIAQFKHGELTGSIAFSPSGALAVGAKNRIYLITPGPAGEPQHGRLP